MILPYYIFKDFTRGLQVNIFFVSLHINLNLLFLIRLALDVRFCLSPGS